MLLVRNCVIALVSLFLLSSCGQVQIHDDEWCIDAGDEGAFCFHTLSDSERDIPKPEWDTLRRGWIAGSPQAYGNLETTVKQLCAQTRKCTHEIKKKLEAFFDRVYEAQARAAK